MAILLLFSLKWYTDFTVPQRVEGWVELVTAARLCSPCTVAVVINTQLSTVSFEPQRLHIVVSCGTDRPMCQGWIQAWADLAVPHWPKVARSSMPPSQGRAITQILNLEPLFCMKMDKRLSALGVFTSLASAPGSHWGSASDPHYRSFPLWWQILDLPLHCVWQVRAMWNKVKSWC